MFSPGIYNQQRSQYVGNTMGEMMNLLPFAQQRYDESRNLFDSMDSYIDNIPHLEGDREELEMTVAPFRQVVNEARESGDYRSLYDKATKFAKKMEQDRGIQTVQSSYQNMLKQQELESKLGSSGLTFTDPNKHKSITYDENGKANYKVYVPRVEERKDWDGKMVDIYGILKADGFSIDLRNHAGDIQGFLEHGKVSGISDPKVRKYLSDAYNRYIDSPEGVQDYERLRVIGNDQGSGPMEAEDAKADIEKRLLSVGTGMVYSDTSKSYQQNPYAKEAKDLAERDKGMITFAPASGINSLRSIFPKKVTIDENGKLVSELDFETYFNQNYTNESDAFADRVVGGIDAFMHGSADMFVDWLTGKRNKAPSDPTKVSAINNIRESIAVQRGISPSEVKEGLIADYINSNLDKPIPNIITESLNEKETKLFDELYARKREKSADGKKEIFELGQLSKSIIKVNGENMSAETLFHPDTGMFKDVERTRIVDKFTNDNPYGFAALPGEAAGYHMQITMKDGKVHHLPMQGSVETQQLARQGNPAAISAVVENGIYQAGMNTMGGITTQPLNVGGLTVNIVKNMFDNSVKMVDASDPTNVISSVSNEELIKELQIQETDSPSVVGMKMRLPLERAQAMILIEKIKIK